MLLLWPLQQSAAMQVRMRYPKCELHLCHFNDVLHFDVQAENKRSYLCHRRHLVKWLFVMGRYKAKQQYNLPYTSESTHLVTIKGAVAKD